MASNNTQAVGSVGERIRALRLELGYTQRELSSPGVSYAYLSRIEAGTRQPTLSALIVLVEQLRVYAQWQLDNMLPLDDETAVEVVEYAELLQAATTLTALNLLTGDEHGPCPLCGRPESKPGGTKNGKHNENGHT